MKKYRQQEKQLAELFKTKFCYLAHLKNSSNDLNCYDSDVIFSWNLPSAMRRTIYSLIDNIFKSNSSIDVNNVIKDDVISFDRMSTADEHWIHEAYVSFICLNQLRYVIPNYGLLYAVVQIPTTQEVVLIKENLQQHPTMTQALKTATLHDCLNWLLQIILALEIAVIEFGFTHYNLHTDNIRIKNITKSDVAYVHNNETLLLSCNSIAVMVDFQLSHVKSALKDATVAEHFGTVNYKNRGIFWNETRPFYDIYKLLMWMILTLKRQNNPVYKELGRLCRFFGESTFDNLEIDSRHSFIYNLEITNNERTRSIREFLTLILLEFPEVEGKMLNKASDYKDTNKLLTLFPLQLKNYINRYYGLVRRSIELQQLNSDVYLDVFREQQDYEQLLNREFDAIWKYFLDRFNHNKAILEQEIQQLKSIDLTAKLSVKDQADFVKRGLFVNQSSDILTSEYELLIQFHLLVRNTRPAWTVTMEDRL